ncbi:hypothetical protein OBBRIDRAFT_793079 [Obba rivulosa]|uniref:Uncharacterized protein n=1 Tax=Obba rivulosa TaxID=1052685 RepID=A0A8E2DL28_9APHY|nr:hypothetical protein OBBRIDRAFT_793079 [Obba rivulosa]
MLHKLPYIGHHSLIDRSVAEMSLAMSLFPATLLPLSSAPSWIIVDGHFQPLMLAMETMMYCLILLLSIGRVTDVEEAKFTYYLSPITSQRPHYVLISTTQYLSQVPPMMDLEPSIALDWTRMHHQFEPDKVEERWACLPLVTSSPDEHYIQNERPVEPSARAHDDQVSTKPRDILASGEPSSELSCCPQSRRKTTLSTLPEALPSGVCPRLHCHHPIAFITPSYRSSPHHGNAQEGFCRHTATPGIKRY